MTAEEILQAIHDWFHGHTKTVPPEAHRFIKGKPLWKIHEELELAKTEGWMSIKRKGSP